MTDNEIIKAVECCVKGLKYCPKECPMRDNGIFLKYQCRYGLLRAVIELIAHLKAERNKYKIKAQYQKGELARLNKQVAEQKVEIERLKDHNKQLRYNRKQITSEAINEFAEMVKNVFPSIAGAIDYFVKEITEAKK